MTDYHFSENLLTLFAQLTPWVQALLVLGLCVVVLGVAYLLKEIVVAITQSFNRPSEQTVKECPCGEWKQLQRELIQKMDRLLSRSILNFHIGRH